ncbi:MAG: hypothetical protein IK032_01130 [Bacteroidales bacterium]|nr:hypothetical protein [Bacteroidales bacterium]
MAARGALEQTQTQFHGRGWRKTPAEQKHKRVAKIKKHRKDEKKYF